MSEQKTAEEIALKAKAFLVDQKYLAVTVTNQYEVDYVVKWLKVFNPTHMLILNGGRLGMGEDRTFGVHISLTAGYLSANCDEEFANKAGCTLIHFYEFKDKVEQYETEQIAALQERVKELEGVLSLILPALKDRDRHQGCKYIIEKAEQVLNPKP